ncbi:hypothetical protein N7462_001026 [Penicillium macrosclerotiorum]|uniref:uncharacterized protein n=1 Tax=Penicillium macrosclerotiorum TaxID=303699 RepID=UPI002546E5BA|nr:uncharacterized protein N7462_001026 [Penicillium macrosclerotiorum]KAJ5699021.1 hypothetical protein N7462_001026 [Penicillium macrosclerotiorum]
MGSELGILHADSKLEPEITPVTIWWACWACIWTLAVVLGMTYLISRRNTSPIRIRGLCLSLSPVVLLHLYWISVQLGDMPGALVPGDAELFNYVRLLTACSIHPELDLQSES